MPAAICDRVDASGLMASGNRETAITKKSNGLITLDGLRIAILKSRFMVCKYIFIMPKPFGQIRMNPDEW